MSKLIDVALGILTEQRPIYIKDAQGQPMVPQPVPCHLDGFDDSGANNPGHGRQPSINKEASEPEKGAMTASLASVSNKDGTSNGSSQADDRVLGTELRILIAKRPSHTVYGGYWELPGGKIDPGESPEQALVREFEEELGIIVTPGDPLDRVIHTYPHARVQLFPFFCTRVSGQIQNLAVTDHKWVLPNELNAFEFPEANLPIIKQMQQILKNSGRKTALRPQ